jgi:hypothetical protein
MWAIIAIAAFLLIDVALVAWALSASHPDVNAKPGPIPTFTNRPATPTVSPTPTPPPAPSVVAAPRLLIAVSATEAYRATPGACAAGNNTAADTVFEKSTDAGATWQASNLGQYKFHTMLTLSGASDTQISAVVGAGANCAIGAYSSFTGGQFWQEYPNNLASANYIDPADRSKIHTGGAAQPAPCPAALQLASGANSTAVLCADTVFTRAGDGTWASAPVAGVLALTASDSGYTLAVAGVAGCPGVSIQSLSVGGAPTAVGCAASVTAPAEVTLAQQGQNVWLWSGDKVAVSTTAGATW